MGAAVRTAIPQPDMRRVSNRRQSSTGLPPWAPLAYPIAVAVPIVLGFLVGGPLLGLLAAVILAVVVVTFAVQPHPPHASRALAPGLAIVLVVALAGTVLVLATDGTAHTIGWGIVAIAAVIAVALAFLEVGLSEDRERADRE